MNIICYVDWRNAAVSFSQWLWRWHLLKWPDCRHCRCGSSV